MQNDPGCVSGIQSLYYKNNLLIDIYKKQIKKIGGCPSFTISSVCENREKTFHLFIRDHILIKF